MSEQTAVSSEVFDQWFEAMGQRVAMIGKESSDGRKLVMIVGTVWAALLGQCDAEDRGDEETAKKCAALAELIWNDTIRAQCATWLDYQVTLVARQEMLNQKPELAALSQRIDFLAALMRSPVRIKTGADGKKFAQRETPVLQIKGVSPRVKIIRGMAFQFLGNHTIAVPHLRDEEEFALVANLDDGSIWLRTLPDTTPDHGRPVHFTYPA